MMTNDRFLCATNTPPYLAYLEPGGELQPVSEPALPRFPTFPRRSSSAFIACLGRPVDSGAPEWLYALVVISPDHEIADMLPGAAVYAPPAWDPAGERLLFVRSSPESPVQEAVLYDVRQGAESVLFKVEGLRSVGWADEGRLVYSTVSTVRSRDLSSGRETDLYEHPVAADFQRFGTDDTYVSLDQVAPSPSGGLAFVLRWCHQGKPCRDEAAILSTGTLTVLPETPAWSPRWSEDGRLGVATTSGIRIVDDPGTREIPVSDLHSFDWVSL